MSSAPSTYPSELRVFPIDSTEVLVVWDRIPDVERNGEITSYEVSLRALNFTMITNRTRTVNRFQFFEQLQEFAVYSIAVSGSTANGPGPFSPPVVVTTLEDSKLTTIIPHI